MLFFAVSGSGDPAFLTSFPTRRSSDLASVALLLPGVASGVELETLAVFDRSVVRLELTFTTNVNAFAAWLSEKIGRASCRDRAYASEVAISEAENKLEPDGNGAETTTDGDYEG